MGSIKQFEDLFAWQKARQLTAAIYCVARGSDLAKDYGLAGQMQRAAVSVMSNIAEGFERGTPADFYRFLMIARASCAELRSQLYVALDVGYIDHQQFNSLLTQATEVARIIGGLRASVAKKKNTER